MKSAEHPLVTVNFTVRIKQIHRYRYLGFKSLFFKIKICTAVLFEILLLSPYWEIRSDPESDTGPKFTEKSDPDPEK